MDIKRINELLQKRYVLKNELAELEAQANKFYKDIEKNSDFMTPIEKIDKLYHFKKGYTYDKSSLQKSLDINQRDISSASTMPVMEYAQLVERFLNSVGDYKVVYVYVTNPDEKSKENNDFCLGVINPNSFIVDGDPQDNNAYIIASGDENILKSIKKGDKSQTSLEVPIFECDNTLHDLISKVRRIIPAFKLSVDGGCDGAHKNDINNWLADEIRSYLGILPANQKENNPTM